jgi:hypothetical protein
VTAPNTNRDQLAAIIDPNGFGHVVLDRDSVPRLADAIIAAGWTPSARADLATARTQLAELRAEVEVCCDIADETGYLNPNQLRAALVAVPVVSS